MATIKPAQVYDAPKSRVWEYLTNDALPGLLCMPSENFSPEKGQRFKFRNPPSKFWDGVFDNTVIDQEAPSFLSYRCQSGKPRWTPW